VKNKSNNKNNVASALIKSKPEFPWGKSKALADNLTLNGCLRRSTTMEALEGQWKTRNTL